MSPAILARKKIITLISNTTAVSIFVVKYLEIVQIPAIRIIISVYTTSDILIYNLFIFISWNRMAGNI